MKPALGQVCSLHAPFDKDLEDYAAGHCHAIDVWLTKLEIYLQSHSCDDVRGLLEQYEMQVPAASFQGGLLTSQGPARELAWELFGARLDLCRELAIETLVVSCDVSAPLGERDLERTRTSLQQAAHQAGEQGVRVALELQARAAFGNNLQTAAVLVAEVASPALGLCLDAFHFHVGPSKTEDLIYLTKENLFHVQLCDLADIPREFATDADRILPGDGDIPLKTIVNYLAEMEYDGWVAVELMNPRIWQIPPRQFGEIGMTALRKVLGQASMD